MILQPKDTTVAYRCPECGATVFSVVGALALSGDMIKLKCELDKVTILYIWVQVIMVFGRV